MLSEGETVATPAYLVDEEIRIDGQEEIVNWIRRDSIKSPIQLIGEETVDVRRKGD